jgi:hypothetical protein
VLKIGAMIFAGFAPRHNDYYTTVCYTVIVGVKPNDIQKKYRRCNLSPLFQQRSIITWIKESTNRDFLISNNIIGGANDEEIH